MIMHAYTCLSIEKAQGHRRQNLPVHLSGYIIMYIIIDSFKHKNSGRDTHSEADTAQAIR